MIGLPSLVEVTLAFPRRILPPFAQPGLRHRVRSRLLSWFLLFTGLTSALGAELPFADDYASRGVIEGRSGSGSGSNVGASRETGEPRHADVPGGRSVWLSWTAPADGLASLSAAGSSFDTVIAVYAYESELKGEGTGPKDPTQPFDGLKIVARLDDDTGTRDGRLQFGVRAGVRYAIAVDGFGRASGAIQLTWDLVATDSIIPAVTTSEPDRSLQLGDTLTLSVDISTTNEELDLRWYRDDEDLDDGEEATLVIPSFSAADVGTYRVAIRIGNVEFFSAPIEIQLNSEGQVTTLARDKLLRALESPLVGVASAAGQARRAGPGGQPRGLRTAGLAATPIGVTRGFNGSQVFSTVYAQRDPDEPDHCGVAGGATYWFAYVPPVNGRLMLNTDGSSFDTVLAAYTFAAPFTGYQDLVPVVCDQNGGANGLTSRMEFQVEANRTYLAVVDGVGGARGSVHLNYQLTAAPAATAPGVTRQPADLTVTEGDPARIEVEAMGTEPLTYQWRRDGMPLSGATSRAFVLDTTSTLDSGGYDVLIANAAGTVTSATARLTVLPRPAGPSFVSQPAGLTLQPGDPVRLTAAVAGSEPLTRQWRKDGIDLPGYNLDTLIIPSGTPSDAGRYSLVVSNPVGVAESAAVTVRFLHELRLTIETRGSEIHLTMPGARGWRYVVEVAPIVPQAAWTAMDAAEGDGSPLVFRRPMSPAGGECFRAWAE